MALRTLIANQRIKEIEERELEIRSEFGYLDETEKRYEDLTKTKTTTRKSMKSLREAKRLKSPGQS